MAVCPGSTSWARMYLSARADQRHAQQARTAVTVSTRLAIPRNVSNCPAKEVPGASSRSAEDRTARSRPTASAIRACAASSASATGAASVACKKPSLTSSASLRASYGSSAAPTRSAGRDTPAASRCRR